MSMYPVHGVTDLECHQTPTLLETEGDIAHDQKSCSRRSLCRRSWMSPESLAESKQPTWCLQSDHGSVNKPPTLWQKEEISVKIFTTYKKSFSLVFWEEWFVGVTPFYLKFWVNWPHWSKIADFEPIFPRSASAITPSDKSSINTNRKSTMRFLMSPRWTSYIVPEPPKGDGLKNAKCPKFEQ